jgi:hypothetical protein
MVKRVVKVTTKTELKTYTALKECFDDSQINVDRPHAPNRDAVDYVHQFRDGKVESETRNYVTSIAPNFV